MIDRETAILIMAILLAGFAVVLHLIGSLEISETVFLILLAVSLVAGDRLRMRDPERVLARALRASLALQPVVVRDPASRTVTVYTVAELPRGVEKLFQRYAKKLGYELRFARHSGIEVMSRV